MNVSLIIANKLANLPVDRKKSPMRPAAITNYVAVVREMGKQAINLLGQEVSGEEVVPISTCFRKQALI